ncbi:MAG TPA: hypothetical protein VFK89_06330 [Actinomycetota bacterium]|nr:hypothetical protein [Actinomycetota bacterium]
MARWLIATAVVASLVSCSSSVRVSGPQPTPFGAPRVDLEAVAQHAAQFKDAKNSRPAGSQEEFAAASYITAHLQKAGYFVQLDPVPVTDTVRSTNVIALPPSGGDPKVIVVCAYTRGTAVWLGDGGSIGLFLELARALRVAAPDHAVEFVGLGGEGAPVPGTYLGSRRLVQTLVDADEHPTVIELWDVDPEPSSVSWFAKGPDAHRLVGLAPGGRVSSIGGREPSDPFDEAGLGHDLVSGSARGAAAALLDLLTRAAG